MDKRENCHSRSIDYEFKVLLLDEPTSGLDPYMTKEIKDIILKISKEKTS